MSEDDENMKITKRRNSVWDLYEDLFERMERRFMDIFRERSFAMPSWDADLCCLEPLVDYKMTKDNIIVTADLPNVEKPNIEVNCTDNSIEIKAEMKSEISFKKWGTTSFQQNFRYFHKALSLPTKINTDEVKATFKNGLLQIIAPLKREKTKIDID